MSQISFLIPPPLDGEKPAERTAGCTHVVYPMPNIYELIVVANIEKEGYSVTYNDFVLSDKSRDDFEVHIKNDNSFVFCIWTVNLSIATDLEALKIIRNYHPNKPVVFMGPGATYYSAKFLLDENDYVVRGEPDDSVVELICSLFNNTGVEGLKGISYVRNGKVMHAPSYPLIKNLDNLPFPSRKHIQYYTFRNPKLKASPYTAVVTSRNCPYNCVYCVPSSLTFAREIEYKQIEHKKPPISFRSVENVNAELDEIAQMGYKSIAFVDDNFIWKADRLRAICAKLKEHNFQWGCQARADAINEEVAAILAYAGCCYIDLGAESFDDDILKYIKKGLNARQVYDAINVLNKYKVPVKLNILIGTSPLETKESIKRTLKQTRRLKVSQVMFNIVAPFPGTEFYNLAKENGWIKGGEYVPTDVQRNSILEYPHISASEMERILYWGNLRFFLRPSVIFAHISKFRSFNDFRNAWKALMIKFFG